MVYLCDYHDKQGGQQYIADGLGTTDFGETSTGAYELHEGLGFARVTR